MRGCEGTRVLMVIPPGLRDERSIEIEREGKERRERERGKMGEGRYGPPPSGTTGKV